MVLRPLINVSADGQRAMGRWWEFSMRGQLGGKAEWAAGILENEYVRVLRVTIGPHEKLARHTHPQTGAVVRERERNCLSHLEQRAQIGHA